MQLRSATQSTRKAVASPVQPAPPLPKPQTLHLTDLPIEILLNVIYQGDLNTLLTLRHTCKAFHNLSQAQDSILKNWTEIHHLDDYAAPFGTLTYPERINRAFARSQFADSILNTIRIQNANPENRPIRCSRKRLRSLALLLDEVNLTGRDPSDIIEGRMTVGMNHVFIFGAMITCTSLLKRLYYDDVCFPPLLHDIRDLG
jgi:hypothetical protein